MISSNFEPLNAIQIREKMKSTIDEIMIFENITSTNQFLLDQGILRKQVCLANVQSNGKGRQGKHWLSPPNSGLWLSLQWFENTPPPSTLGLKLAVNLVEILNLSNLGIKWSNDIVWREKYKLAGFLIETKQIGKQWQWVIGLGLNIKMPENHQVNQLWTDLYRISGKTFDRNELAAQILDCFLETLENKDFQINQIHWQKYDVLFQKPVILHFSNQSSLEGIACGIEENGALKVLIDNEIKTVMSGDVSLKMFF
ncbi:MAG: putative BirA bifunctional protein [Pseudomonadota bacterium]|jgi:BirA family biotin operon repressor/biotin-[acetyl-CoA-carboxylase] ligase